MSSSAISRYRTRRTIITEQSVRVPLPRGTADAIVLAAAVKLAAAAGHPDAFGFNVKTSYPDQQVVNYRTP